MKKILVLIILSLNGCISVPSDGPHVHVRELTEYRRYSTIDFQQKTSAEDIKLFRWNEKIGHPVDEIALIIVSDDSYHGNPREILEVFKLKAAQLGANAIAVDEVTTQNHMAIDLLGVAEELTGNKNTWGKDSVFIGQAKAIYVDFPKTTTGPLDFYGARKSDLKKPIPLDRLSFPPKK